MRTVLLLCLISLFACKVDVLEILKCVVSKPKVQELGLKLFSYLYTKEYSELVPALLKSLPDLYNAVVECVSNPNQDVLLKSSAAGDKCEHIIKYTLCTLGCEDENPFQDCHKICSETFC